MNIDAKDISIYVTLYKTGFRIGGCIESLVLNLRRSEMDLRFLFFFITSTLSLPIEDLGIEVLQKPDLCQVVAKIGDQITIDYVGYLGSKYARKIESENDLTFNLGEDDVIEGLNQGIEGMCVGERRKLTIPHHLAFGCKGKGTIPPHATVYYEVELKS